MHGLDPNIIHQNKFLFLKGGGDGDANEIIFSQKNCGNKIALGSTCEEKTGS